VVGLRDPLARNPAAIAKEAKLNPARVRFVWKEYAASDSEFVQRRLGGDGTSTPLEQFTAVFQPPPSLQAVVRNSTLVLSGTAPYEWVEPVRAGATKIPGITAINGDGLVVEFDPKLVRQRFRDEFGLPERVDANLRNGRLILTGEATHAWLDRVRRGALRIAGVQVLDDRLVVDIDQRAFHEARLVIEDASILFVLNRDSVSPDAALAEIAEAARRCFAAASSMGVNVVLELRGYGDAVGTEAENAELSRRRAEAVRVSLVEKGLEEQKLISLGLGTPPPPGPGEKPGAGKFDRRVFFRIVIQP